LNDFTATMTADHAGRFGYFATLPMPDFTASAREAARVLDNGTADGVVLLANNHGDYLGAEGQDELWRSLDERGAVVFVHPAELPARLPARCADSPLQPASGPTTRHWRRLPGLLELDLRGQGEVGD
jgi:hypothetical protein